LLAFGDWTFGVAAPEVDETPLPNEPPRDYVVRLAETKARVAADAATTGQLVLAADTTVVDAGRILGKPQDEAGARLVLRQLRGLTHEVLTGIAALRPKDGRMVTDVCATAVPMRNYSEAEIEEYVQSGDPLDKAGSYAIHDPVFDPVRGLTGCYASVMGLPMCHVSRLLQRLEVAASPEIPARCQAELRYDCPISEAVLRGDDVG
jgi:MAF protein